MFNYLSSMTQWEPLHLASAATAPLGVPVTTLIFTLTWILGIIEKVNSANILCHTLIYSSRFTMSFEQMHSQEKVGMAMYRI